MFECVGTRIDDPELVIKDGDDDSIVSTPFHFDGATTPYCLRDCALPVI